MDFPGSIDPRTMEFNSIPYGDEMIADGDYATKMYSKLAWEAYEKFFAARISAASQISKKIQKNTEKNVSSDSESDDDVLFFTRSAKKRIPPEGYVCNICHVPGHYIDVCVKAMNASGLTPYQGKKPCLGLFVCPKCKHKWANKDSSANSFQCCKKCNLPTYPKKQFDLNKMTEAEIRTFKQSLKITKSSLFCKDA